MSRHAWQGPCPLTKVNSPEAIESSVTSNYPIKPLRSSNSFSIAFLFFFLRNRWIDGIIAIVASHRSRFSETSSPFNVSPRPFIAAKWIYLTAPLLTAAKKKCNAILKPIRRYRTFLHLARDFSPSLCSFPPFSFPEKGQNRFKASLFL